MDYRPGYYRVFDYFSRTPKVLWVVDPRPLSDVEKIATLRIPGQENERPQGIDMIDCSGLALWRPRILRPWRGRIGFAAPLASLGEKFAGTYGFPAPRHLHFLPYPLPLASRAESKTRVPSLVFLGRLDPIKRPWVFVEVARRVPDADFILLGRNHFSGAGSWMPENLPSNVKLMGHVEGEEKRRTIAQAWALVNPSIHEALPVSFVEAFAACIPVISCQDPGGLVSRFGTYVGRFDGSGLDAVEPIARAIRNMTPDWSTQLGSSARDWAISTHSADSFRAGFFEMCRALRVSGSAPAGEKTADNLPKRIDELG
jgi:glycosyltransferase involved in cell wall biosynthesis